MKSFSKIDLAKYATSFVVGAGVSKIVKCIVANNTDPKNLKDKVVIGVGAYVIGSMVADLAQDYTNAKIDEMVAFYQKAKAEAHAYVYGEPVVVDAEVVSETE